MAIIIESKNIYSKKQDIKKNNVIKHIDQNISDIAVKTGNILEKDFSFDFYIISNGAANPLFTIGDDDTFELLGQEFDVDRPLQYNPEYKKISATITSPIKKARIELDEFGNTLRSHKVVLYEKRLEYRDNLLNEERYSETRKEIEHTPDYELSENGEEIRFSIRDIVLDPHMIYGQLISLKIQLEGEYIETNDVSYKYGEEGSIDNFSIYGGDFVQSTNYLEGQKDKNYSESILSNYVNAWKDGKETATLSCSIGDYYDDYGDKVISSNDYSKVKIENDSVSFSYEVDEQRIYFRKNKYSNEHLLIYYQYTVYISGSPIDYIGYVEIDRYAQEATAWHSPQIYDIKIISCYYLHDKQIFETNDQVIPFYSSPQGEIPISMSNDMPKVFYVLKSRVYYDGVVRQELSLQEGGKYEGSKGLLFSVDPNDTSIHMISGIGEFKGKHLFVPAFDEYGNKVTQIRKYDGNELYGAFLGNEQIVSVFINDNIEDIGTSAFQECSNLKNIYFSESSQCTSIGSWAFHKCKSLKYIKLPPKLNKISEGLLNDCSNLERIFLPKSITEFEDDVFSNCVKLKTVEIEDISSYCSAVRDSVSTKASPFFNNADLYYEGKIVENLSLNYNNLTVVGATSFAHSRSIKNYVIGDRIHDIKPYSFYDCSNLEEIILGSGVINIRLRAFDNSIKIKRVFYNGTSTSAKNINIGSYNEPLTSATWYYYSETQPTAQGNFWHYVNGKPKIW